MAHEKNTINNKQCEEFDDQYEDIKENVREVDKMEHPQGSMAQGNDE